MEDAPPYTASITVPVIAASASPAIAAFVVMLNNLANETVWMRFMMMDAKSVRGSEVPYALVVRIVSHASWRTDVPYDTQADERDTHGVLSIARSTDHPADPVDIPNIEYRTVDVATLDRWHPTDRWPLNRGVLNLVEDQELGFEVSLGLIRDNVPDVPENNAAIGWIVGRARDAHLHAALAVDAVLREEVRDAQEAIARGLGYANILRNSLFDGSRILTAYCGHVIADSAAQLLVIIRNPDLDALGAVAHLDLLAIRARDLYFANNRAAPAGDHQQIIGARIRAVDNTILSRLTTIAQTLYLVPAAQELLGKMQRAALAAMRALEVALAYEVELDRTDPDVIY